MQKYIKVDNMCLLCITWHRSISKKNTVRVPPYHGFFFLLNLNSTQGKIDNEGLKFSIKLLK